MDRSAKGFSSYTIKWIAIAAMLIDHIAWGFVPTYSLAGQLMHIVGRITAPTMCFFLTEGYVHTHNVNAYTWRLGLFALISQVPFTVFETGQLRFFTPGGLSGSINVIYTLFLCLLAVRVCDKVQNGALRVLAVLGLCLLSIPGDWAYFDILFTLAFWQNRGNFRAQLRSFSMVAILMVLLSTWSSVVVGRPIYSQLFQAGVLLCLPILSLYSGRRGGGRNSKWTFYIFYPVHLFVLGLIKFWI